MPKPVSPQSTSLSDEPSGADLIVASQVESGAGTETPELTLAWARDALTGQPRYILELSPRQNGRACGCECPACGSDLIAVNAGKLEFRRRPHFRHPAGSLRQSCEIVAARLAALRALQDLGEFELPGRRMAGNFRGLTQTFHVWIDGPRERVRLRSVDFRDRARAVLTLDDGRELVVELVGTAVRSEMGLEPIEAKASELGEQRATIVIAIDDPAVAALDPQALRQRLRLLDDAVCWRRHWDDAELAALAEQQARQTADEALDVLSDEDLREIGEGIDDQTPPEVRRESRLHLEVKRILERSGWLNAPGHTVVEELAYGKPVPLRHEWAMPAQRLTLSEVKLERAVGRIVPDVICTATNEQGEKLAPLLIEVTVTNAIDASRLERIRAVGNAALEIDLSLATGKVDRAGLEQLVLEETAIKRWLYAAREAEVIARLREELALERDLLGEQERTAPPAELPTRNPDGTFGPQPGSLDAIDSIHAITRQRLLQIEESAEKLRAMSMAELGERYLSAVVALSYAHNELGTGPLSFNQEREAEFRIAKASLEVAQQELSNRGYPACRDRSLVGQRGILVRLASIRQGIPYGYRYDTVFQVINAAMNVRDHSEATLYLIAIHAYKPPMTDEQAKHVGGWRARVWESLKNGESHYKRFPHCDALIALLFPEMSAALQDQRLRLLV